MRLLSRFLIVLFICVAAIVLPAAPAQGASGPTISIPDSGIPGDEVTIYGYNFTYPGYVDIYYDGHLLDLYVDGVYRNDVTPDSEGHFQATFFVPEGRGGNHTVRAQESQLIVEKLFTVKPGLTANPGDGPVGTNVTVQGRGFAGNEQGIQLRYYYLGTTYETVVQNITADENGSWHKSFFVPSSAQAPHIIRAVRAGSGLTAVRDAAFEVTPAIGIVDGSGTPIAHPSGSPGQNITMTGWGFRAGDSYIEILFEGERAQTGIIRASDNGYWEGDFEVPALPIGTYSVTAGGQLTPEEDVNTLSFEIRPGLVLSPGDGHVGTLLTVTGYGFPINEDVSVMYEGSPMGTAETDDQGTFQTNFLVPESQHGARTVTAEDGENTVTATFTMESDAPGTPELESPEEGGGSGFIGSIRPTFRWVGVSDVSGVYYNLQISASDNVTGTGAFADPIVFHQDIVGTNYTLNGAEALSYGKYYWIVQAIDGAGNAGPWTAPRSFRAGALPLWAFILGIVVFVGLVGTLIYRLMIRRRIYYL